MAIEGSDEVTDEVQMLTRAEKVQRVVFLLALIVLLLDVFIWRK